MADTEHTQLMLLDPASFQARERHPRPERAARTEASVETLTLPFDRPKPARPLARLQARLERPRPAARQAEPGPDEDTTCVFVVRGKLSSKGRAELLDALATRAGGDVRSQYSFEARVPGDRVLGRLEAKTLTLQFHGRGARQRWLAAIRQVASEHGLIEPE